MFVRRFSPLAPIFSPDGSNPGQPAAGSAPAAGTPAPAAGAPPATPPAGNDAPPAWAKALMAEVESLKGGKQKAEADANAAAAAKLTVEQQLAAQRAEFESYKATAAKVQIKAEVGEVARGVNFASPAFAEAGLALFQAQHRLEVKDGAVLAFGPDGKPQHLTQAFAAWTKGPGAIFVSAAAQPGPGAPGAAPPAGSTPAKAWKDMTDEEFFAKWKAGQNADGTPMKGFISTQNPYAANRNRINAAFTEHMARGRN